MKVAILAGGLGTRLSEETTIKPKPMVEVGGRSDKPMHLHTEDDLYYIQNYSIFLIYRF